MKKSLLKLKNLEKNPYKKMDYYNNLYEVLKGGRSSRSRSRPSTSSRSRSSRSRNRPSTSSRSRSRSSKSTRNKYGSRSYYISRKRNS